MAQVNLGRIGFVNKGSWNNGVNYKLNDVVKYGGSTYAAKRPNTGITPPTNGTDTDDWFYFVNNSDYVDKTSNQDIIGIKNFTNGITTSKINGDKTIGGKTTFTVSPIVPTPTTGTQAVNKEYVDSMSVLPIGAILNAYTIFNNCIVAFGGEFNRADYPKLWAYLQANPTLLKTQAQWQTEATANGRICGFFSDGNGTTTFGVPNLDKAFLRPDSRGVASYQADVFKSHSHGVPGSLNGGSTEGSVDWNTSNTTSTSYNTGTTGGTETRPKNIAVLPLIVAK